MRFEFNGIQSKNSNFFHNLQNLLFFHMLEKLELEQKEDEEKKEPRRQRRRHTQIDGRMRFLMRRN